MTESDLLHQLQALANSPLVLDRKAAIKFGADLLAQGVAREGARAVLTGLAQSDPFIIIREAAQAALKADDARTSPPAAPAYIFAARCPEGHVSHFDKREYCPRNSQVVRRTVYRDGAQVEEIELRCKQAGCGKDFYVTVDCEGYK